MADDSRSSSSSDSDSDSNPPDIAPPPTTQNVFKNDGSFMELFRKMNNEQKNSSNQIENSSNISSVKTEVTEPSCASTSSATPAEPAPKRSTALSIIGKRRGGRALPTGVVKKAKKSDDSEEEGKQDAWSRYLNEVKKYKDQSCEEEGKRRPLVK